MLYDHVDQRTADLKRARPIYDALLKAMGYTRISEDAENICWYDPAAPAAQPFFSLMLDAHHQPPKTRVAFRAVDRDQVNLLAESARRAGAQNYEAPHVCAEYTGNYYAAFFEDADGNKLEICCRS